MLRISHHTECVAVTYWRDHDQPYEEAHDADEQQQQLSAVTSSDQVRVQVTHRRHQGLQAHKLKGRGETGLSVGDMDFMLFSLVLCVCVCVSVWLIQHQLRLVSLIRLHIWA